VGVQQRGQRCRGAIEDAGAALLVLLDLAEFVRALRRIDPTGGPHDDRGLPVRRGDAMVRMGIDGLRGEVDAAAVTEAWNRASTITDDHNKRGDRAPEQCSTPTRSPALSLAERHPRVASHEGG
jgi:hypothetical protein